MNILYRENWTRLAAEEVMEFQEALFRAMRGNTGNGGGSGRTLYYTAQAHKWSFSSSFLYSLTLITTIGELPSHHVKFKSVEVMYNAGALSFIPDLQSRLRSWSFNEIRASFPPRGWLRNPFLTHDGVTLIRG